MRILNVRLLACVLLLFAAGFIKAQEETEKPAIKIAKANRVDNSDKVGVCWWACADMLGREFGILPLIDMKNRVLDTGIGRDQGARIEDIEYWVKELGLKARARSAGEKDVKALCKWLDDGLPVIVSMERWEGGTGSHAILLTKVTRKKIDWDNGKGYKTKDYVVTYIDPNHSQYTYENTWEWFTQHWNGKMYTFDPKEQDVKLVRLRPGRLLVATGTYQRGDLGMPPKEPVGGVRVLPPQYAVQAPPVYPHQLPYAANTALSDHYPDPSKQPSNQDIKDGVNRPDDLLRIPVYGQDTYDYHSEFRKKYGGGTTSP